MEIPPRAHPPLPKNSAGSVAPPEKNSQKFWHSHDAGASLQVQHVRNAPLATVGLKKGGLSRWAHKQTHAPQQTEALFETKADIGVVSSLNEKPKHHAGVSYLRG